jgi:hypothetical protein
MDETTQQTNLTIADLASIRDLIDTACSRGAYRASEMKSVGEIYERLNAFLSEVVAQANATSANQQGEPK